jgi:membrane peptidoglycan carboxypeptidase
VAKNPATRRMLRDRMRATVPGNGNGMPRWLQALLALAGLGVIAVAAAGATGYGVYRSYASGLQPPDQVIANEPSGGAQIFDRNGNLLYEYVDDRSGLRSPVKLEDISPWMIAATISTEDASYWSNPGINTRGMVRAGLEALHLKSADAANTTGGSSITQQLVKNVYIAPKDRYARSYSRKIKETVYAIELTNRYSKNQILEWYLNQISYGGLYNGVEAAAQGYFGKSAKDLTLPEAALLAGIPAGPSSYDPINHPEAAIARRNEVLRLMKSRNRVDVPGENGDTLPASRYQVNEDGATVDATDTAFYLSTLAPLNITKQRFPVKAPHWVFDVIEPRLRAMFGEEALYRGGLRVTTTIDVNLQQKAQDILENWISQFEESSDAHNGALVAIDPRTSEIITYVGSRDYFRDDIQGKNDNAQALNSPGSTLKPFTYETAFEELGWGPGTEILDTPITYKDGDKDFTPSNPSHDFHGPITAHDALGNSLNIPAFKTALYAGVPNVVDEYKKFGLTTLDRGGYGPSVTLGGVDIKLIDVTYAYTVLANMGIMRGVETTETRTEGNRTLDPVAILQITRANGDVVYPKTDDHRVKVQEKKIVEPQYAYMIDSILSDPSAFCLTYGCGALSIGRPWGVKTGTSEPFEDSHAIGETWTYGFTPDLVTGVWAGNADNSPVHNITSTSISYRAVRDFMEEALKDTPASTFDRPPGLVNVDTCTPSGLKAGPECGRPVHNLLPEATAPQKEDDWWRKVKVDIRNGLLATELTPPQFVQERVGLALPENLAHLTCDNPTASHDCFLQAQANEWIKVLNANAAPTDKSNGQAPVRIDTPKNGEKVGSVVQITGMADTPDFVAYRLEFGAVDSPTSPPLAWNLIIRSETKQPGGGLGLWNTTGLPDGLYTVRLVLEDKTRGELSTYVSVQVGAGNIRHSPTPLPTPTPLSLGGGDN